jgi:hypothetical protein
MPATQIRRAFSPENDGVVTAEEVVGPKMI